MARWTYGCGRRGLAAFLALALLGLGPAGALAEDEKGAKPGTRQEHKARMLEKFDADGDGKLSPAERDAARKAKAERREKKRIERWDKDGDGKLSDEERAARRETVNQQKKQQRQQQKPSAATE